MHAQRHPRRPWSLLATTAAVAAMAMFGSLGYLLLGMGSVTSRFSDERIAATQTANGERDLLLFHQAVIGLDETGTVAVAALRRDLAIQQLSTVGRQRAGDAELGAVVRDLERIDLPSLVARPGARERRAAVSRRLAAIERRFKARHDREDQRFSRLINDAMVARVDAQRLLGGLIVLTLALGGAWTLRSLRRSRGDLTLARRVARVNERRYRSLVRSSSDLTLLVDATGRISYASPSAEVHTGLDADALLGRPVAALAHVDDVAAVERCLRELTRDGDREARLELRTLHRDGRTRHVDATVTNLLDDDDVRALLLNLRDVTDRKQLEAQLSRLAFHDPLTGLANRALLHERVGHATARARRAGGPGMALLLLDLDDFKAVNDSLGHDEGDRLLVAVAERLNGCVRADDTVARLGGDEFVVFLEDVADADAATRLAAKLVSAVTAPLMVGGERMPLRVSVGVRFADEPDVTAEHLLRDADLAMYAAKSAGKGRWALFEPAMHDTATAELSLRSELHRAVEDDQLVLHYQPIVDVPDGRVKGFEALVRWRHPVHGLMSPDRFIGLAEETGLIVGIGEWVLREALAAARRLNDAAGRDDLTISVNVSPRQFESVDVAALVVSAARDAGVRPELVVVELTEGVFLTSTDVVTRRLEELRATGAQLALDDFGTGFSSLSYLQRLPLDALKIDRSFVATLASDPSRTALVASIVELARALGLRTVAEGVELPDQHALLADLGCDNAQGYLFSRPLPEAEALASMLAARQDQRAASSR